MKKTLIALSIAMASSVAASADERPTMEAFLGADASLHNNDYNIDTTVGGDLGLSYNVSDDWALEAWYSLADGDVSRSSEEADVQNVSLNALRYLSEGQRRTFFTFGLSELMIDPENSNQRDNMTVDVGLGFKEYFDNNFIFRGDLIGRFFEDNSGAFTVDPTVRFSLGYVFGRKSTSVAAAAPVVAEAPKEVVAVAPAPAPAAPVDSDNDGVYDADDKCPDTGSTLKVDETGCPITLTETVKIDLNINFPNNSDEVLAQYLPEIQAVAEFMGQYEGTVVEIKGYTDDRGAASYNQQLSERRARMVAGILTSRYGISADRVKSVGFGEADPIATNATSEGRAANRRVVAEVSTSVQKTEVK